MRVLRKKISRRDIMPNTNKYTYIYIHVNASVSQKRYVIIVIIVVFSRIISHSKRERAVPKRENRLAQRQIFPAQIVPALARRRIFAFGA